MTSTSSDLAFRTAVLTACGASGSVLDELKAYTENPFRAANLDRLPEGPLEDEPHLEAWTAYEAESRRSGVFETLQKRLVQLNFPIRVGISDDPAYRSATRRGHVESAAAFAPGLVLQRPGELELTIHPTLAGRIPLLVPAVREDFVTLVQALTARNEPETIPDSMGACIVTGLNNWDRVASYRASWERGRESPPGESDWFAELRRLGSRKELYQDRFILLSRGPYSAVPAAEIGLDEDEWLARSLQIRREHECAHYFTCRALGSMRNHLLDELIADFVGLVQAFGHYRADLALRFLGLEAFPMQPTQGRLAYYRGDPPLSDDAMTALRDLAFRCIRNLGELAERRQVTRENRERLARFIFALTQVGLEALASDEAAGRVEEYLR